MKNPERRESSVQRLLACIAVEDGQKGTMRYILPDLISCEVCGMLWTPRPHESCPRCTLVDAREDADRGWAMARGNREWSMREQAEDKRTIEELVEANRVADADLERVEKERDTAKSLLSAANERIAALDKDTRDAEQPYSDVLASDLLPGLNAQVDALFACVEALEGVLKEAQTALQLFSCGHDLVCADPACRESGHEHEGYGEDWYCSEYCPCVPACAEFEPETCPGSRIVSEVIEKIGAALASKDKDHV